MYLGSEFFRCLAKKSPGPCLCGGGSEIGGGEGAQRTSTPGVQPLTINNKKFKKTSNVYLPLKIRQPQTIVAHLGVGSYNLL